MTCEEQRQSIKTQRSAGPPLRQEGGAPTGGVRGKSTLQGGGGPTTSHTSKFQPHSASKRNFLNPITGLNPLSGPLTFSSIPPLTTGSGSGPACVKKNRRTRGQTGGKLGCQVGMRFIQHHQGVGSSSARDQESPRSSPFVAVLPALLHSGGMSALMYYSHVGSSPFETERLMAPYSAQPLSESI